jgi:hypothetical protein
MVAASGRPGGLPLLKIVGLKPLMDRWPRLVLKAGYCLANLVGLGASRLAQARS